MHDPAYFLEISEREPTRDLLGDLLRTYARAGRALGLYPIVNFQYSSTTLYQVSYHIKYLLF